MNDAYLVGDGYDVEPLLTPDEVAEILRIPKDRVYKLPIKRVVISPRCTRFRPAEVRRFIESRIEDAA